MNIVSIIERLTPRVTALVVGLFAFVAVLAQATPVRAADYLLNICPNGGYQATPASVNLGASSNYSGTGGPRTCTWVGKKNFVWRCNGGGNVVPISYEVVNDRTGARGSRQYYCNNGATVNPPNSLQIGASNDSYHIHVHLNGGRWTSAYARVY